MKKLFTALCTFALVLLLAAFGSKPVQLLNSNKLIDLGKAITYVPPGVPAQQNSRPTDNTEATESTTAPTEEATASPAASEPQNVTVDIRVRGTDIYYHGKTVPSVASLEALIRPNVNSRVTFRLIDHYADAQSYREVLQLLERLQQEIGLAFREVQEG